MRSDSNIVRLICASSTTRYDRQWKERYVQISAFMQNKPNAFLDQVEKPLLGAVPQTLLRIWIDSFH